MNIKNTTIRITKNTLPLRKTTNEGVSIEKRVFEILIGRSFSPYIPIQFFNNLTRVDNLIMETIDTEGNISQIVLPEDMHSGLIRYFQNSPDILASGDCLGFIVEVLGGKRGDRFVDDGDFEYLGAQEIIDSGDLNIGDVISISDGTQEGWNSGKYHYALYLGDNLFISKLGKDGVLVVTDFEQLQSIYPEYVFSVKILLKKKKPPQR